MEAGDGQSWGARLADQAGAEAGGRAGRVPGCRVLASWARFPVARTIAMMPKGTEFVAGVTDPILQEAHQ